MADATTLRIYRGDKAGGGEDMVERLTQVPTTSRARWWTTRSSTRCTRAVQAKPCFRLDLAVRWNCKAGKCGSCSAEVNGKPRLDVHGPDGQVPGRRADRDPADEDVPGDEGSGLRRVVELRGQQEDSAVQDAPVERRAAVLAGRGGSRAGVSQVHRVLPVPGRVPRAARPRSENRTLADRGSLCAWPASRCTRWTMPTERDC